MPPKSKKGAKPSGDPAKPTPAPVAAPPNWPPLTPVLPASDLQLTPVLPGQILTISSFFTSTLCRTYLHFLQKSIPLTTTPGTPKRGDAVRVNDRFQLHDARFAAALYRDTGLAELIAREPAETWGGHVLGLNPNIRIYRYTTGQFFDKHYDDANHVELDGVRGRTTWTLLVYVTGAVDGIVGGETVFYTEATKRRQGETIVAPLEKGAALLHKHGRDCLVHEGRLVEDDGGVGKWVIRSDLVVR